MDNSRLTRQLSFLLELEKLKNIYRRTYVMHEDRTENDAEHSFHLAIMACILAEHAKEPVDVLHVMKMVLVHDVVEIDAGDTYCYDTEANKDKAARELIAAERLFVLLPPDQAAEYRGLWDEFEARQTPESRFANALDRIQPMLLTFHNDGKSWRKNGIRAEQVRGRNCPVISAGSDDLGVLAAQMIEEAAAAGMLL